MSLKRGHAAKLMSCCKFGQRAHDTLSMNSGNRKHDRGSPTGFSSVAANGAGAVGVATAAPAAAAAELLSINQLSARQAAKAISM